MREWGTGLEQVSKEKGINQNKKEEDNEIKIRITKANQAYCDWEFQIHWNKLELVNPRSHDEI